MKHNIKIDLSLIKSVTIDQASSLTSSTISYRIQRRTSEKQQSKRSLSKKSKDTSLQSHNFRTCYVKASPIKKMQQSEHTPMRVSRINACSSEMIVKERTPTPALGYSHVKAKTVKQKIDQDKEVTLLYQLRIAELQKSLASETDKKMNVQKRATTFQRQLRGKLKKINQLQLNFQECSTKCREAQNKLKQFQDLASNYEDNLTQAKNNLQKLKIAIKNNKTHQLQLQNKKMRNEIQNLKESVILLKNQNHKNSQQNRLLKSQIYFLKEVVKKLSAQEYILQKQLQISMLKKQLSQTKTQKEQILQKIVQIKNVQISKLKMSLDKLQIKVNYQNRIKSLQVQKVNLKSKKDLVSLRDKFVLISKQLSEYKKQNQVLKRKNNLFWSFQSERKSILQSNRTRSTQSDQHFQLILSP